MTIVRVENFQLSIGEGAGAIVVKAAEALQAGSVIAYPTETVYGLGCDYLNEEGYRAIQKLKALEKPRPWILLIPDENWLDKLALEEVRTSRLKRLISVFWPGPLTLILPAAKDVPDHVVGPERMISMRVSPDPFVRVLMDRYERPITSTSANPTGHEPATGVPRLIDYFSSSSETIALAIDDGIRSGPPSTLVRVVDDEWIVEREGAISSNQIATACRT